MKLLLDMNMSPMWVTALEDAGYAVTHWAALGPADAPDHVLMSYAHDHGMIIFTQDLDFGIALAISGADSPSVVQLRAADALPSAVGRPVVDGLRQTRRELLEGALVTIDARRTRVRVLPIRPAFER